MVSFQDIFHEGPLTPAASRRAILHLVRIKEGSPPVTCREAAERFH
jgi:hypothetical protein